MSRYFSLCKKATLCSKEFEFYYKRDASHVAILKIAETSTAANRIYVTLDVAAEICERLDLLQQLYEFEFIPPPENGQLCYEEIVEEELTYKLELSVHANQQNLQITQSKRRFTRGPCNTINIPDMSNFRRELVELVEQISTQYLELRVETDDSGISKVVRGNRVAVIYCPVRPWLHTCSDERQLLFDPQLVGLILFQQSRDRVHHYCKSNYPNLAVDTYVNISYIQEESNISYENLNIRWIRRSD